MIKHLKNKERINFLLQNKHYRRLHLILYLLSVTAIVLVYFVTIIIFSKFTNILLTAITSLILGLTLVFKRDILVKRISEHLENKKRKENKIKEKSGLKTTLRNIAPKTKKMKLNITPKVPFKEKIKHFKKSIKKDKNQKQKDYLEIK